MNRLLSINILLVLFLTSFMFYSCLSIKNYDYKHIECQEIPTEAVNIAITDYSKRLRKRKDFNIITSVELFIVYTSTDWFYITIKPWLPSLDDNGKYRLRDDKFPIEELDKHIGKIPPSWIPTQYTEKNDVLYVWHDPQIVLTEKIINVLAKYNLLNYSENEEMILTTDGGDMSYIFCKTNFKRKYYRKVKASFVTPLPTCGCH